MCRSHRHHSSVTQKCSVEAIHTGGEHSCGCCWQPCNSVGQIQWALWQIIGQACLYTCHRGVGGFLWGRAQSHREHDRSWCSQDEGVWTQYTNLSAWGAPLHPEAKGCRLEAHSRLCSSGCGAPSAHTKSAHAELFCFWSTMSVACASYTLLTYSPAAYGWPLKCLGSIQ